MSEFPPSWTEVELGDVIDYGKTSKAEPNEIPDDAWLLELEDIEKDTSKLLVRVTFGDRRSKSTKNRFSTGDVLYGKLRPYLNKVLRADRDGFCTTEIVPIKANAAVDGGYLFHWVRHPRFLDYVTNVSHGLNMPRLGTDAGRKAPFVLAPIEEQRRIATKLDGLRSKVDACHERLDRVPQILKKFREAVLEAAVTGRLTEQWRVKHGAPAPEADVLLKDVWSDASYGSAAKSKGTGLIPVLRMGNIQCGVLDWHDLVYTSDEKEITKYSLQPGDVLFNRTNSPDLVGKSAVYHGERPAIYAGYLIRVRCGARLHPDFLGYCLNSPAGRHYCWSVKTDGVSQSNINASKLGDFPFMLPSLLEQVEIVRRVAELSSLSETFQRRYQDAVARIERLTPSILAKAFRGELVPQDPNDEPTGEMLERVRVVHDGETVPIMKIRAARSKGS